VLIRASWAKACSGSIIESTRSDDRARDVEQLTHRCTAVMEALIRRHPEHWMWTYRRFRHSPDLEGDPYA
jgi:lauroyl/myristoyl acyltransferase